MKKFRSTICLLLVLVLAVSAFSGCSWFKKNNTNNEPEKQVNTFGSATNGIFVYSDGTIEDCLIRAFEQDYYDADEYRTYLQAELDEYNKEHPFKAPTTTNEKGETVEVSVNTTVSIRVTECLSKSKKLYQNLYYATAEDYVNYNKSEIEKRGGTTLQTGTLATADQSVLTASYVDKSGNAVDIQQYAVSKDAGKYRYIICNFTAILYNDGSFVGCTSTGEYSSQYNSVNVPEGKTVIAIYYKK